MMVEQSSTQQQTPSEKEKSNLKRFLSVEELTNMKIPFKSFEEYYELGEEIGEGGYGKVYTATCRESKVIYAAKFVIQQPRQQEIDECLFMKSISC